MVNVSVILLSLVKVEQRSVFSEQEDISSDSVDFRLSLCVYVYV